MSADRNGVGGGIGGQESNRRGIRTPKEASL